MNLSSASVLSIAAAGVLAAPLATAAPIYADDVLADNPVAYYRLSETTGTTVADAAGSNTGSVSATGVNLTAAGPVGDGFGSPNSAAFFDGAENTGINLGTSVTADLAGSSAVTLETWIGDDYGTATDASYVAMFVGATTGGGGTTTGANITVRNNTVRVGARSQGSDGFKAGALFSVGAVETDFIHVVGVIDFENDRITTYLNGVQAGSSNITGFGSDTFNPGTQNAAVGVVANRDAGTGATTFASNYRGTLDESAFYGRALTATEVADHYAARVPEPGTLALAGLGSLCLLARRRQA